MKHRKTTIVLAALALCACSTPAETYVEADRATHDAIAPVHRQYVEADQTIGEDVRQRRLRTLETWRIRLEAAEGK